MAGSEASPIASGGRTTVLLADDEPVVRELLDEALRQAGYLVLTACDGVDALALSDGHAGSIDLLVTDMLMPRLGGLGLAAQLRRRRPGLRVLFLTGDGPAGLNGEAVLAKPFTSSLLLARVGQLLAQRS